MSSPRKPRPIPASDTVWLRRRIAVLAWRAVTVVFVALGMLGVVLPVVPSVPFLLVAAWSAGKGWPAFEQWLLDHAHFGPPIRRWRENGSVPRRAKWFATLAMSSSAIGMQFFDAIPLFVRIGVPVVMVAVAIWLWMRPEA